MASCRAVMMISGSTPFSFARASIVCCSGLVIVPSLELHVEFGALDRAERYPMVLVALRAEQQRVLVDALDVPREVLLAVHRRLHDHLRAAAGEPAELLGSPERPIQPRRRHLEGVSAVERILDVENRAHLAAHHRAVLDADAVFGSAGRTRLVDEDPDDPADRFAAQLHVEHIEAVRRRDALGYRPNPFDRVHPAAATPQNTKSGHEPTPVLPGRPRTINATTTEGVRATDAPAGRSPGHPRSRLRRACRQAECSGRNRSGTPASRSRAPARADGPAAPGRVPGTDHPRAPARGPRPGPSGPCPRYFSAGPSAGPAASV